jgi:hypothetical protein
VIREKFNLIYELQKKNQELQGVKKSSLIGQGDFAGANNVMRSAMNIKHHTQHLTIDNPEFPYLFDGKENLIGENSSFYEKTDKVYRVEHIIKKYNELLKGKCYIALYFLYCKDDDSYRVVERKEVENLTENFGFDYKNEFLDNAEVGEVIPKDTVLYTSTSYDENMNVSIGVNGRILYATHPAVQDDAIIISESFAKRMISNQVSAKTIPISENTIFLNLYGKDGEHRGLPNIGDIITDGILAATRNVKESRMFSDLRDSALRNINQQSDQVFYGDGEVIDINVYCNNPNIKSNRSNMQLIQYYNDAKTFYREVYKVCSMILKSGAKNIDKEINRWKRKAMDYLDTQALWAFNDNIFSNLMVEILIRKKEPIKIGRKLTGRSGNKTVVSSIWPDEDMPYLTTDAYTDEHGVVHPRGEAERVDLITNSLAIINRTIPMAIYEPSITFILDRVRKHMATLKSLDEQKDFMFDIMKILNPKQTKHMKELYETLTDREKKKFIEAAISLDHNSLINTSNGIYVKWEAFNTEFKLRDAIIEIYEKYGDIITPYNIFIPKPKWGRDIYIGKDCIGFQYMLLLKQSGERGFSVRSAGAISDESLPEKSHESKIGKLWHSETPIRFGEYESPNFMIITAPEDFALVTALYRSSIDGRRFMYEAILSEDGKYDIPDKFTSRSAEILQVYLKSLGVRMETIFDESEFIGEPEHDDEIVAYNLRNSVIFCTPNEMYYLNKLSKVYKYYIRERPNAIYDIDEVWDYCMENLPFKKKHLTDNIINLFKNNLESFTN